MAMIRPMAKLAAFLLVLGVAATASAQRHQPFIDFGYFEPDFQFFAPAEVGDFGGLEPPNTGVYFDYDKLYLNCTRPEHEPSLDSPYDGDFSWGNRYEIGYMTEQDSGWQAVLQHYIVDENIIVFQERLDRFNADDDLAGGNPDPILQDRNPRHYDLRTSLNSARYSSVELNKVWRRKTFHNGGVLEPLIGFRGMSFRDQYLRDNYVRFQETAAPAVPGQPNPAVPDVNGVYEQLTTDQALYYNQMFGGQLGARFFHQRGHWLLSAEVRMFGCVNFQILENNQFTKLTRYTALGGDVELELNSRTTTYTNNTQFVWGGEVRAEAAYELTRDISLRFGLLFIDLGQGVGRGNTLRFDNQDVVMTGLTAGLTINR
jgi:hypothetical protein